MNNELLPCPFCGGAGFIQCEDHRMQSRPPIYIGECDRCGMSLGDWHKSEADAIAAWNRRTPRPAWEETVLAAARAYREACQAWGKLTTDDLIHRPREATEAAMAGNKAANTLQVAASQPEETPDAE